MVEEAQIKLHKSWVQVGIEIPLDVKDFLEDIAHEKKTTVAAVIADLLMRGGETTGKPVPSSLKLVGRRPRGRPSGS